MSYTPGQRVKLLANEDEGWEEELATVDSVNEMPWGTSFVVLVDERDRHDIHDDGLREVTVEQMEALNDE